MAKALSDKAMATTNGKRHYRRSLLASGDRLLPECDPNGVWARLFSEERNRLVAHCGGEETISETQWLAARRAAVLEAELVHVEDSIGKARAKGEEPKRSLVEYYTRIADKQRKHCEVLGVERTAREVEDW